MGCCPCCYHHCNCIDTMHMRETRFDLIFLVFNATFSNISAISRRPVLVVEEVGENHRPYW